MDINIIVVNYNLEVYNMLKCFTPCIYYREILNNPKKIKCDFKDKELKDISNKEKKKCKRFKSYSDLKNKE